MGLRSYPRLYFELLFSGFTLIMGMGLSSAFLPIFASDLDPTGVLVGFTVSAWFLSRVFMELPSGMLADLVGRRKLLVLGLATAVVGSFMCSMASSIYVLIIGRGLWGLGSALFFMSNTALLLDIIDTDKRGRALGTFQGVEFVGSFLGAPIGGFIAAAMGYQRVFLIASFLIFCSFVGAFTSKRLRQTDVSTSRRSSLRIGETLATLGSLSLIGVYVNSFTRMLISTGIMSTILPLYFNTWLGLSVEMIGIIVSFRTAGIILATSSSGYLSEMLGRKTVILIGIVLEAAGLLLYTFIAAFELLLALGFLEGLGGGLVMTSLVVLLSEAAPSTLRGGAIGMYRTFMDLGGFLGPLFFMIPFTTLGPYYVFVLGIIILSLNAALIMAVKKPRTE